MFDVSVCKLPGSTNKHEHRQHSHTSLTDAKTSLISKQSLQDQCMAFFQHVPDPYCSALLCSGQNEYA